LRRPVGRQSGAGKLINKLSHDQESCGQVQELRNLTSQTERPRARARVCARVRIGVDCRSLSRGWLCALRWVVDHRLSICDAEEALGDVIAEARDLREKITSGVVSADNARRALAGLRQRHRVIAAHVPSIKISYDWAVRTIEDPAAKVAELTSKFGSLQQ
jgi:hypothetical protein